MVGCGQAPPLGTSTATGSPMLSSSSPTSQSVLATCAMAAAPAARTAATIAYQPSAAQFLLFGGDTIVNGALQSVGDTWHWNGMNWSRDTGTGPSARAFAVMDFDVGRGNVILYGGQYDAAGQSPVSLFDTWLWDGTRWAAILSSPAPKLRSPTGVYDVAHGNLVLFGIGNSGTETWLWNGSQWAAANPAHSPSPRAGSGMAYVAATRQAVLFGGFSQGLGRLNDTWLWDGTDWRNAQAIPAPPARVSPTLVSGQRAILFGGGGDSGALADAWRWDGSTWTPLTAANVPPARRAAAGASDGNYLVVIGGDSTGLLPDAWRWDGNDWKQC
jgi:hypothetical protein